MSQAKEAASSAPSRTVRRAKLAPVVLIENTRVVTEDCRWCGAEADKFSAHSRACPMGERYKQVQQLGGVPMAPLKGEALLAFFR